MAKALLRISTEVSTIMSSPGQKRGTCGHVTHEQIHQLSTPTYRERKSKEKKLVLSSPAPTVVDPSHMSVLGKVEGDKAVKPETTPSAKKKKRSDSLKPSASKKKPSTSSRPSSEDLKSLDDKWAERFSRLEAMLFLCNRL